MEALAFLNDFLSMLTQEIGQQKGSFCERWKKMDMHGVESVDQSEATFLNPGIKTPVAYFSKSCISTETSFGTGVSSINKGVRHYGYNLLWSS